MKRLGYSLIELMVSLFLSSLIMVILMRSVLWIQQQMTSTLQEIQQVEEKAWVASFLQARFHQAGFTPCRSLDELVRVDTREKPEVLQSVELKKRDHLVLRHMSHVFAKAYQIEDSKTIWVDALNVNSAYPLIISDCRHAEIHEIERLHVERERTCVSLKKPLVYSYDLPFYVGEWISESFLIKHQSLYYQHHHVDEIAPWIRQMSGILGQAHGHTVLTLDIGDKHQQIKIYGRNT